MTDIFVQSRYSVDRKKLKSRTKAFFAKLGIDDRLYGISIAIVGDRKMATVHKKFAKKNGTTPVLAFPLQGTITEEEGITMLGEIVVSFPQAVLFAADENKLVDDKIGELVEHGLMNLLNASS